MKTTKPKAAAAARIGAGLDEAARKTGRRHGLAVGAIDETGQVKAGSHTAGVKRQYPGWRRRHQARSRWYHQRTRLALRTENILVS